MSNSQSTDEFHTCKISASFKVFLVVLLICALASISYFLAKEGEDWGEIAGLMAIVIWAIGVCCWFITSIVKRVRNLPNLSDRERLYADDLNRLKITSTIKQTFFSGMDTQEALALMIIMGDLFKWLLFYIFAGGSIIVICRNDTFLNKMLTFSLALTWCPWIENLLLKKINYKITFLLKVILSVLIFSIVITSSS